MGEKRKNEQERSQTRKTLQIRHNSKTDFTDRFSDVENDSVGLSEIHTELQTDLEEKLRMDN